MEKKVWRQAGMTKGYQGREMVQPSFQAGPQPLHRSVSARMGGHAPRDPACVRGCTQAAVHACAS